MPTPRARSRPVLLVVLAAVVAAGLASRAPPLADVLVAQTGDGLYAAAVFVVLALLVPGATSARLAATAFLICALVEWAQRLQWPWLVELRRTRVGALLLGQGFLWADMLAYAVAAFAAGALDHVARCRRRR